ncbi:MAG: hypothetical protein GXP52_08520 [Deltaproteobacteria bacterium]|nr:hypothetical protein [Deltaproteobacteria bacterium]
MIKFKGWMLSWVLRLQRMTWRVHIEGRENLDRLYADEKRFLLCFWHGKYVPIFPLLEGCKACVVSSRSVRGSVIAEIGRNFGYQSTQMPDRPSRDSLRLMREVLSEARAWGIAVDGPLGPRGRVKSGVIRMASALEFDLLPVSLDSRRKMVFNRRWDRMEIPLPFTTVCLVFGEPIKVPPELRFGQVKNLADKLAEAISQLDAKTENMVRENLPQKECLKDFH